MIRFRTIAKSATATLTLALLGACGGGAGEANSQLAGTVGVGNTPPVVLPPIAAPDASLPTLTLPATVANGTVVELACGRTYRGSLDLRGKSDVTVRTAGDCGPAVITAGQPITGWTHHQGQIYSVPLGFDAAQVLIDGQPVAKAHWPNRPQTWASATGSGANWIGYAMPNADLTDATLIFRAHDWAIEGRRITGYANGVMNLASLNDAAFGGYAPGGQPTFYVEGKLWMLDAPGEWAMANGRLYLWAPDGQSPEGRVWAAADQHGIQAGNSSNVSVQNIDIFATATGIHADGARNLKVNGVAISNASRYGIWNSGGSGLLVDGATLRNIRHDAIAVRWGGGGEVIQNSRIEAAGVVGMQTNSRAAINLTLTSNSTIQNNTVKDSGYIGIRFFRDSVVRNNTVATTCLVLTDCGAIYGSAADQSPLNSRVEGNTVSGAGLGQRLAWGMFIDDADNVIVSGNRFSGNANGLMVLDGGANTITGNIFETSRQSHLQMAESSGAAKVRNNSVTGNTFSARDGEETYRVSSDLGSTSVLQFGVFDANTHVSSSPVFANFNGAALSFGQWRTQTGKDANSTYQP